MMRTFLVLGACCSLALLVAVSGCTTRNPPVTGDASVDAAIVIEVDAARLPDAFTPSCEPGEVECASGCTRVAGDSNNCGSCGNVCPAGVTCAVGRCDCEAPMLACDGSCLDVSSDDRHCGACDNACSAIQVCEAGTCVLDCDAPLSVCTNTVDGEPVQVCTDTQTDVVNCGTCNTTCAAGSTCIAGRCQCPPGWLNCGGTCTDVSIETNNCGSCGISCGVGGVCMGGSCSTCGDGLEGCGGRCADLMTEAFNCGMCGRRCGAGEGCAGGLCVCTAGLTDCGAGCLDLLTDPNDCGTCGTDCGPGGVCSAGTCTCAAGLTMCSGSCYDTNTTLAHCGGCDMPCPALVGGVCAGGTCGCPAGLTDCGGTCVDTALDEANCGMCGMACMAGDFCIMSVCSDAPPIRYMATVPSAGAVSFIDACAAPGATMILPMSDDGSARVPLSFPFRYFETDLAMGTMVNVVSNGWMGLGGGTLATISSASFPTASTPNGVIAPYWGDQITRGPICVATVGTAPNQQFVVQWNDVGHYEFLSPPVGSVTYEVILTQTTGTIDFVYGTMTGARSFGVGMENNTGTVGLSGCPTGFRCIPTTGQQIRFVPIP